MSNSSSVFFTGMEASDADQLAGLFHEINRRTGNRWSLANTADSANVLVIDVDTLYGHMTWLRSHNSGQRVVALTAGQRADADHVLKRPVNADAMRDMLSSLFTPSETNADASASLMTSASPHAEVAMSGDTVETEIVKADAPAISEVISTVETPTPAPTNTTSRRLIQLLLNGEAHAGPMAIQLPDHAPLMFDVNQKTFVASNAIKGFLPHTQAMIEPSMLNSVDAADFEAQRSSVGTQPFVRLLWLAALGGNQGAIPANAPNARFRLNKWPQIEREFPKHFRIATAMMKGFQTPSELAEQSGVPIEDVNDFIYASLVSGHAEADSPAVNVVSNNTQKNVLERLRGTR